MPFVVDHPPIDADRTVAALCRTGSGPMATPPGTHRTLKVVFGRAHGRPTVRVTWPLVIDDPSKLSAAARDETSWDWGTAWSDSFESGDFRGWSWSGQGDPSYGHRSVVTCGDDGVPPLGGEHVARFETTPDDIAHGRYHAKLYRGFGTGLGTPASRPPADVSGIYSTWFYLPRTYRVPPHSWVNIFQFKEEYRVGDDTTSDPLWWVQLAPPAWANHMAHGYGERRVSAARNDAPVAFINHWKSNWRTPRHFVPVPLGRWFEVRAVLRQGDRIDFSLDGHRLDTARASEYPVSPFHGDASAAWTFGIGNYSTGVNGPLFADRASYAPF